MDLFTTVLAIMSLNFFFLRFFFWYFFFHFEQKLKSFIGKYNSVPIVKLHLLIYFNFYIINICSINRAQIHNIILFSLPIDTCMFTADRTIFFDDIVIDFFFFPYTPFWSVNAYFFSRFLPSQISNLLSVFELLHMKLLLPHFQIILIRFSYHNGSFWNLLSIDGSTHFYASSLNSKTSFARTILSP